MKIDLLVSPSVTNNLSPIENNVGLLSWERPTTYSIGELGMATVLYLLNPFQISQVDAIISI